MLRVFALALALAASVFAQGFALHSGDRVVFYGDSITDQRLYNVFAETFIHTRYPRLDITYTHSGWGGDRVTGGGGGPIDLRVKRDIAPYRPTMVTIMLGMNDGGYHPATPETFGWYKTGYLRMLGLIKAAAPGVQITLIRPSPFDEVTRPPIQHGGYNPALVQFGDFLSALAAQEHCLLADFNAPLVHMLERAVREDSDIAQRIIPDRVHPGPAGHLVMMAQLMKAWNADGLVSSVVIDAARARATTAKAQVTGLARTAGGVVWDATEESLPMPVDLNDATVDLALRSAGFMDTMDAESLRVTNLAAGHYALRIDGRQVKVFTAGELAQGVNLATLPTPMNQQAREVSALVRKRCDTHNIGWRNVQVPLADDHFAKAGSAASALDALEAEIAARIQSASQPKPHHFELIAVPAEAASLPAGFTPIFNGKDLTGWHISQSSHHGHTQAWTVRDGVLSGTQDKPGDGGILLTDSRYSNFEIYMEINPDWGCDGGLLLRSDQAGDAYQVMIDYLPGGNIGGIYGEGLPDVPGSAADFEPHWKKGQWNTLRARISGAIPRIDVWLNGHQITAWSDTMNHLPGGLTDGHIALQVHRGDRWVAGGYHRFRNIAVRELGD